MNPTLVSTATALLAQSRPRPQIGLTAILIGVGLCVIVFGLLSFIFRNKD